MKRSEKANKIGKILDELYPTQPIPLDHKDAYTLLVAVMLSAQTTDKKVNEVTPYLFSRADNPEKMSGLNDVWYGVQIARKGWLESSDILNTKSGSEIESLFEVR